MDFLLGTLYAPLSSWGDIAVGEVRGSWDRPSRSALLGLVGAALGIERHREDEHRALAAALGTAVCVRSSGTAVVDYHTAQTASESTLKRHRFATRRQLLQVEDLDTRLSRRTYRQDALHVMALWNPISWDEGDARFRMDHLVKAIAQPVFPLFAGRKTGVFALPINPRLVSAATLAAAFRAYDPVPGSLAEAYRVPALSSNAPCEVSHDPCVGFESGLSLLRHEVRRDEVQSRGAWQFANRRVDVGLLHAEER
jgi:CRISPR system Cascade subunit CasD